MKPTPSSTIVDRYTPTYESCSGRSIMYLRRRYGAAPAGRARGPSGIASRASRRARTSATTSWNDVAISVGDSSSTGSSAMVPPLLPARQAGRQARIEAHVPDAHAGLLVVVVEPHPGEAPALRVHDAEGG